MPVTQQYYNFKDFPIVSPTELYSVSSVGAAAISSWSAFLVDKLMSKLPPLGQTTKLVVSGLIGSTLEEAQTKSIEVVVNWKGEVSIAGSAFNIYSNVALTVAVTTGLLGIGFAGAGTFFGGIVIGGVVSFAWSQFINFSTSSLQSLIEFGFNQNVDVDLKFFDKTGAHVSGVLYRDGLDGTVNKYANAIGNFIAQAGSEITNGGNLEFEEFGLNTKYTLYNGNFTDMLVGATTAASIDEFLTAGDGKNLKAHAYKGVSDDYYFFKDNVVALDIPVSVAGVKKIITVNNIYDGTVDSSHLLVGDGSGMNLVMNTHADYVLIGGNNSDLLLSGVTNDSLFGNDGDDILIGGKGIDRLNGGIGKDTLDGGDDDDTLIGGLGADIIDGGTGSDTVSYADSASLVNVSLARTTAQFGGSAAGDILSNVENIIGSKSNDVLTGNAVGNKLTGGGGSDTLTGGAGADQFVINTGEGIDTITDPEAGDMVVYDGTTLEGRANGLENGVYKLGGFVLEKQGQNLYITSNGKDSGVTIQNFFPAGYDGKTDYTYMGITIPKEKHDPDYVPPQTPPSPIVLDLNGDGLKYIAYNNDGYNAHFDIDNDGFAEGMEWLDKNDGFLVRDLNGNGVIDNQKEMFGDDSGTTAYYKLAQLDTNNNSKIDAGDAGFNNLRIWQDLNSDGRTQAGELKTLAGLNIANLSLQLTNDTLLNGHAVAGTSNFTRTNGTTGIAADVLLDTRQTDTIYVGTDTSVKPALDLSNLFLPLLRGSGTLPALHYAMTQNPVLKTMVTDLANLDISTQMQEVYDRVHAIIFEWAGATNIAPTGADINKNATKLAVIQHYLDANTTSVYADQDYSSIFNDMVSKFLIQGPLHDVFPDSYYDYETDSLVLGQSPDQILAQAKILAPTNTVDKQIYWNEILRIFQAAGNNITASVEAAAGFPLNTTSMIGTSGNDILTGNFLGNHFQGLAGDDTFYADYTSEIYYNIGDGNDTIKLIPSPENDGVINFGHGITFDSLSFQYSNVGNTEELLISLQGGGSIRISDTNYTFYMTFEDGSLKGFTDINYKIFGGMGTAGDDVLYGTSKDVLMNGFAGNDYIRSDIGNDTIYGGDGDDRIYAGTGNDIIYGGSGYDVIEGNAGADKIDGGTESDWASYTESTTGVNVNLALTTAQSGGDAAGDILSNIENISGSTYNDTLTGNSGDNIIGGMKGADIIDGGAGNDTAYYLSSNEGVNVNLALTTAQSGGDAAGDILISIENIVGSYNNDTLTGNSGDNIINGSVGADIIDGGTGNDTVSYDDFFGGIVKVNLSLTTAQTGGNAQGDILISIENIIGSPYYDTLTGNSANNALSGGAGNDTLIGGLGADKLDGGTGTDTVSYADSSAAVTVNIALITAQSGGDAAGDILSNIENLTGSAFNDILTGNSANNVLTGGAGNDILTGGLGADKLDGNAGVDTASYSTSSAGVTVNLALTTAQKGGDAAGDILTGIENITGSAFNDILTGSSAANIINGLAGNDNINGGAGADIISGDDGDDTITGGVGADRLDGGIGTDTASYTASGSAVTVNLALTTAQSGGDAAGDILTNIENLTGSAFNDTLTGNSSNNIITGGAGNDTLMGGLGVDKLDGGLGTDTASYTASNAAVTVNLGLTTAQSGGDAAGDILTGIENITGSAFNDILTGNNITNIINGGTGDDIIKGGAGADSINGAAGIDTASYDGSNAAVTVNLSLTTAQSGGDAAGDLLSNIENITGSSFADTLTGSGIANILTGGAGNDTINAGTGNDIINGGTGKDSLTGGTGADIFKYSAVADSGAASGVRDIITDFNKTQADKIDLSSFTGDFVFKGTGAFTGAAHEVNYAQVGGNTIVGVDADGNGILDFQIELTGLHTLAAGDFLL